MMRNYSPVGEITFPEGYFMRSYQQGDGVDWCECCIGGSLGIEETTEETFAEKMLKDETVNPANIFFLVSASNEIAGTVTYQYSPKKDTGTIHMVGIKKEYQGLGLALPMNLYAVNKILEDGKTQVDLKTDDWRLPAIKTYLNAGFKPIYSPQEPDMADRWVQVMKKLGIIPCFRNS